MDSLLFLKLFQFYGYVFIGFIIGKIFKKNILIVRKRLTNFLVYFISPVQIFIVLTTSSYSLSLNFVRSLVSLAIGYFLFYSIIIYFVLRKLAVDNKTKGSLYLLIMFPNVMFFNIPIVLSFFSEELTIVVVLYASTMLMLRGTVGVYMSERYGNDSQLGMKDSIIKLLKFPPFIAILLGAIVLVTTPPLPYDIFLSIKPIINLLASVLSAVLIGMILSLLNKEQFYSFKDYLKTVAFWRILFNFIVFAPLLLLVPFDYNAAEIRAILLIIMTSPPAVYNVIFSIFFNLNEKIAATGVAVLTLVSLIILPLTLIIGMSLYGV